MRDSTEGIDDIELDEKLSQNVKAGFAFLDQGVQTVQQAVDQIQSQAGGLQSGVAGGAGSGVLDAGNKAIDDIQNKLTQVLQQVQSIKLPGGAGAGRRAL